MNIGKNILVKWMTITISLLLLSCSESERKSTLVNQEAGIDKYISSLLEEDPDLVVLNSNGAHRVILDHGVENVVLERGDSLVMDYAAYVFNGSPSQLFATSVKEVAEAGNLEITGVEYKPLRIKYGDFPLVQGLENGLEYIALREHSLILFTAKYGFYNDEVYNVPKMSALMYEIIIHEIIKN